ncbi:MAG TPA: hypothetical protein VGW78_03380 [Candidatus Babeliales bacterium]|jgi:uncharacterized membrane protein|nr:hypothetical protein [Candidatus Babeliales bacterium]
MIKKFVCKILIITLFSASNLVIGVGEQDINNCAIQLKQESDRLDYLNSNQWIIDTAKKYIWISLAASALGVIGIYKSAKSNGIIR